MPLVRRRRPPIPTNPRWSWRGIFATDATFAACNAACAAMGISIMECFVSAGAPNNALTRMNQISAPTMGWTQMSGFTPSAGGGSFAINDATCTSIVNGIKNHARNSHIYYIADEPNIQQFTTVQQDANLATMRARRNLIKSLDPQAVVAIADFRQNQMQPAASGRTYGMWGGPEPIGQAVYTDRVLDLVVTSGYASPSIDADPTRLTNQAAWLDQAGVPYIVGISIHENPAGGHSPDYPTQAQVDTQIANVKTTNSQGIWVYIWDQNGVDPRLSTDGSMQTHLGVKMAEVTP